jgi:hypothetical protein
VIAADDLKPFKVSCPEWGGDVWMLPMMGDDRDAFDELQTKKKYPRDDKGNLIEGDWRGLRAAAVGRAMCDESGVKFNPTDADILALGKKNGAALDRCFDELQQRSGLYPQAVEDSEKN